LPARLRPPLAADERVLAWAIAAAAAGDAAAGDPAAGGDAAAGGGAAGAAAPPAVVATNAGLFLPGQPGRLGWHEIHKATWDGRVLSVTPGQVVAERAGYVVTADRPAATVPLPHPGELPNVIRSRVTRSVSYSSHHRLPAGGVLVVARRVPGVDGVSWAVRYDPGTDPADPAVRAATDQLVAGLAETAAPTP
jgi:hypothetical protein